MTLILASSSHLSHPWFWLVPMHVYAACGTNTYTLHIHSACTSLHSFQTRIQTSCTLHVFSMAWHWTRPDSSVQLTYRNVTTLGISALLSNLVETVPHVQKLPEGPHGKQQDYINFVTLGNHPKPAKSFIHYIHSPTGILLQQDRPRRCSLCMKHRQFSATGALLPLQLTCTL